MPRILDLQMPARLTAPDPRLDAVHGCVAVERGPLVYCLEEADLPPGTALADITIDASRPPVVGTERDGTLGTLGIAVTLLHRPRDLAPWPYQESAATTATAQRLEVRLQPYYAWANRGDGAMRVWIPVETSGEAAGPGSS
jgi:DUF1680 family protein